MMDPRSYSSGCYLAAMALTTALIAPSPFFWAPPMWIFILLGAE